MRASVIFLTAWLAFAGGVQAASVTHGFSVGVMLRSYKSEADLEGVRKHFTQDLAGIRAIAKAQGVTDGGEATYKFYAAQSFKGSGFLSGIAGGSTSGSASGGEAQVKPSDMTFGYSGQIIFPVASEDQGFKLFKALSDKGYMASFEGEGIK